MPLNFSVIDFVDNRVGILKDSQLLSMMAILSGTYSVDTFVFLRCVLIEYHLGGGTCPFLPRPFSSPRVEQNL